MKKTRTFIIIQILVILIVLLSYFSIRLNWIRNLPECILKNKYNIICPSCGVTRMGVSLYHFNIKEAFLYNPIFFMIIIYTMILYITYLINFFFKKDIKLFRWWHIVVWGIIIVIFTIIRNIT